MRKHNYIILLCFLACPFLFSQQNSIHIKCTLDSRKDVLNIQQEIIFHNTSDSILTSIFLHNWANSYRDRKTPLFRRFIQDFKKDLYFAKEKELGSSIIQSVTVDFESSNFKELKNNADILEIILNKPLSPNSKIKIAASYNVKIPSERFTNYGIKVY